MPPSTTPDAAAPPPAARAEARVRRPAWLHGAAGAWPLPALLAWAAAWGAQLALAGLGLPAPWPWLAGVALSLAAAALPLPAWRRAIVAGGFPLSALLLGAAAGVPAWAWLLPLALLLLIYPLRAWRDAPVFPTDARALDGLARQVALPPGARILDAGSGLGHGLLALHRLWPQARIEGVERSLPLVWWSRRRCPFARVARGDMWAGSWGGVDLLYLFQRPETMARAWAKATAEMAPGSWLVSLEFAVPGVAETARLTGGQGRPVWLYRVGGGTRLMPARGGR